MIQKTVYSPLELDYPFLKEQGIAYIEQLAGKKWTDYGDHDPGITILEVLAFAIMDLEYRTNFYIEDIWANNPDAVEQPNEKQFYRAEEILPCNPLTQWDFLKVVLDVPGVKNANVCLSNAAKDVKGGYKVFVELEDRIKNTSQATAVLDLVKQRLYAQRNLCEDFFLIQPMRTLAISVKATFEVKNCLAYEEGETIIAHLLYDLQEFLSPRVAFYSISQLLEKGSTIEQIFTGPLLNQGFIDEAELIALKSKSRIYLAEFLDKPVRVPGIKGVLHFELFIESEQGSASSLSIPVVADQALTLNIAKSNIMLSYNGVVITVNWEKVLNILEDIKGRGTLTKAYLQEEEVFVLEGNYRYLEDYVSIQHDFPLLYNVGHEGCSLSELPSKHAKAKQLKSFLLFFDQLFANYLGQLSNIKHAMAIYSEVWNKPDGRLPLDVPRMHTIIKEPTSDLAKDVEFVVQKKYLNLKNTSVHTADQAVEDEAFSKYQAYLNKILESNMHSLDKRSKILDHLLAYFSERFTTYSLNLYPKNEEERLNNLNFNKTLFLKEYIDISRYRSRGAQFTIQDEVVHYVPSGFQRRIYRNLGIKNLEQVSYFHKIIKHNLYLENKVDQSNLDVFLGTNYSINYSDLFIFRGAYANIQSLAIAYGLSEEYYHILKKSDGSYRILLYVDKVQQNAIEMVTGPTALHSLQQAEHIVQQSVEFFRLLNEKCEGFHLIEHILLRPSDRLTEGTDDLYSFRMTLVFPAWPARFQQASFKHAVEEMIITDSPAHLLVNILWLSFEDMEVFETTYQSWNYLKANPKTSKIELNTAAQALMDAIELYSR